MNRRRLLLVLPFDNLTGQVNLDWIDEAVPDVLNRRLASSGFLPIDREDRRYAMDHLGLPQTFQPSRASAIRLAQTLDANDLIFGSFTVTGSRIRVSARVLDLQALHLSAPVEEEAEMAKLLTVLNSVAWRIARQLDPRFPVALNTFVAADPGLSAGIFEDYIRGLIDDTDTAERIRRLKEAVRLDPAFTPALLDLGKAYFSDQQYESAAQMLGRLPRNDPHAREADFYRGLSYLYIGSYAKAEDAFAFVSDQLPLPEVLNDQGVAASRRGKDGTALFRRAIAADPVNADYDFNLAVSLNREKDYAGALYAVDQALKLRPQDTEAQALQAAIRAKSSAARAPHADPPSGAGGDPDPAAAEDTGPLERVARSFNEASFRQAAFAMEQMQAAQMNSWPAAKHAQALSEEGTAFLDQGLILEAEREFQTALELDRGNADAHAGLAVIRQRDGDSQAARQQAQESLQAKPNAAAYLVLARLDLESHQTVQAASDLSSALKLDPQNAAARGLRQQLESRGQSVP